MSNRSIATGRIAGVLGVALVLAACGPTGPTASPASTESASVAPASASPGPSQASATEIYAAIRAAVEQIRGLAPTASVDPVTIDEAQLRKNLETEFDKSNASADLHFSEQ